MISAKEAAEAMRALLVATQQSQMEIEDHRLQIARDQLAIQFDFYCDMTREMQHKYAVALAQKTQDEMNAASEAYIKSEWAKNHPPEPERISPWQLSRDDVAELHLWWDWKQLPDDIKSEMLPPPSPSEMTQAFMDTNPAWRFSPAGTLVASLTDSGRREVDDDERDWLGGLAFLIVAMTIIASLVIVIDHIVMG